MTVDSGPAPIVLFVYNRPRHTDETLMSLEQNSMARESDLFIFSDAANGEGDRPRVARVREAIAQAAERSAFKSIHIECSEQHRGLAESVIAGVGRIINQYGRVIVLEDDLVTSTGFLAFMNDALDRYKGEQRVWSVSGYSPPIVMPAEYEQSIYFTYRGSSWGYATWKDRWDGIDWSVSNYGSFRRSWSARARMNRGGRDMTQMLERQMEGEIDSWAIRWCYAQAMRDSLTVYPVQSLVRNIGLDGSGTHSGRTSEFSVILGERPTMGDLCDPFLHKGVLASFKDMYGTAAQHRRMYVGRRVRRMKAQAKNAGQLRRTGGPAR